MMNRKTSFANILDTTISQIVVEKVEAVLGAMVDALSKIEEDPACQPLAAETIEMIVWKALSKLSRKKLDGIINNRKKKDQRKYPIEALSPPLESTHYVTSDCILGDCQQCIDEAEAEKG